MKSIQSRIILMTCLLVVVSLLIVSAVSVYLNWQATNGTLEQTMTELAKTASMQLSNHLRAYKIITEGAADDERIYNPAASLDEKQAVLDEVVEHYSDFTRGNVLDANGISVFTGDSFSDREYFQKAITGLTWVSEPVVSKVTGKVNIVIAAPIWENGNYGSKVVGVVYLIPTETFLNDAVAEIKISAGAGAQVIRKDGAIIAHQNMDFVATERNNQDIEKTDPSAKAIAALEREMMAGKTGFGTYSINGIDKFLGYAPIEDTNGWSIGVNAPISDFMGFFYQSIIVIAILLAIAIVVTVLVSLRLSAGIGKPVHMLAEVLTTIADTGRMNVDAATYRQIQTHTAKKDEVGTLAHSAIALLNALGTKAEYLNTVAEGDLTADVQCQSEDDAIGKALIKMLGSLNNMFTEINTATHHVADGSKQIAEGSQALAQGSTQQAAAVEQLSSSISEIANKTQENAEMAGKASTLADSIKATAEQGSRQMDDMMNAVKDINQASQSISKVIKVIDDIAFQTNILALNAAVEAARAGQHGKGFAVVAEEVRNLAAKSAGAAKETGGLIANSIEKAELGARIAGETAASLNKIVTGINESSQLVGEIARASEEQSEGISQVNKGIDQVAQVVQQNSATAEESAASSQEMSDQAGVLETLVAHFKLKDAVGGIPSHQQGGSQPRLQMPPKSADASGSDYGKY